MLKLVFTANTKENFYWKDPFSVPLETVHFCQRVGYPIGSPWGRRLATPPGTSTPSTIAAWPSYQYNYHYKSPQSDSPAGLPVELMEHSVESGDTPAADRE